ncbi:MAG: molybdopterin molybdotransferase MoeA [Sulfuricella sp.]|nr:molybdopterin molybdotransferase MoeA [Sulfuricella sp.]
MNDTRKPLLPVHEALALLLESAAALDQSDSIATHQALGRVLAAPLFSSVDVPPLDNSAMDGYAVRMADLATAKPLRVTQRIPAGTVGQPLQPGTAARIFTGAPIPAGCDAVVMQEHCRVEGDTVNIEKPPRPGENIRRAGEDIRSGAQILPAGIKLGPAEMGLAASVGLDSLPVYRKLRVATFFTGDEIVMPGNPLQPGQIYNSNRFLLAGFLAALGCEVIDLGNVPDDFATTVTTLKQAAAQADLVLTSGGVSVGEEDHVKAAVESIGQIDLWKIAVKPGKPLAFGSAAGTPFIGLPGNPVSAFVTFCMFVRPYILRRQGVTDIAPPSFMVRADSAWPKPDQKRREFLRARMTTGEDGGPSVQLHPHQGSGVLTSCAWSDGLIEVVDATPFQRGDQVKFIPFAGLFA